MIDPGTMSVLATFTPCLHELNGCVPRSPWKIFRSAINYSRYSFGMGTGPTGQLKELRSPTGKLLAFTAVSLGYAASVIKDKKRA
jgi:hypothetical protein